MAVLDIDTIGHLPVMSKGNGCALKAVCLHTSYVFTFPKKEKTAEKGINTYLSGILAYKAGSVATLSSHGSELKNKAVNEACDQFELRSYSATNSIPKVIQE